MYQAKSGVKNFPFTGGGGSPWKIFFFQSEHVSNQIGANKNLLFYTMRLSSLFKEF